MDVEPAKVARQPWEGAALLALSLGLLTQIVFAWRLGAPRTLAFDEFHYVPAARDLVAGLADPNWEHPPLAKWLIGAGIRLVGDHAVGWRVLSTLAGSLTVVGMFVIGVHLFASASAGVLVALLTLLNQVVFVQARLATLEIYALAFGTWSFALWISSMERGWSRRQVLARQAGAAALIGAAAACKWSALLAWGCMVGLIGAVRLLQRWELAPLPTPPAATPRRAWETPFFEPRLWRAIRGWELVAIWLILPLALYAALSWPGARAMSWAGLEQMWSAQVALTKEHRYMSSWWSWPLQLRPIWYAFERDPVVTGGAPAQVRGVLLVGNPVVFWVGALAMLAMFVQAWRRGTRVAVVCSAAFLTQWLSWAVIPRKVGFAYYYLGASLWLSVALAAIAVEIGAPLSVRRRYILYTALTAVTAAGFIYFYPILAARGVPIERFMRWIWLPGWV